MLSPSASITAVQQNDPIKNVFSDWYRVNSITEGLAKSIGQGNNKKISLVFQNDAFYTEFIDFFKAAAKKEGVEIVSEDLINPGQSDFKTIFSKIKASGSNGIVFGMYDEKMVLGFLKDRKQIIPSVALYSNEVIRQYIDNADYKTYIEGTVFVENAQINPQFIEKYKKAYSVEPVLSASTAYDATMIVADTLRNGSVDPIEYLRTHSFVTTSFGTMSFDSIGGVVTENKQYQIRKVVGGKII